jgi:hypothetical protein
VNTQNNPSAEAQVFTISAEPQSFTTPAEPQGFTTADILWALGIWSVILSLSPVVVFYMLMVA